MESFFEDIEEYKHCVKQGSVRRAYRGLLEYMLALKSSLATNYPAYFVSGSLYTGYMDMTYFSFHPQSFQQRRLRVGIVLIHEDCHFEAWLAGFNKQIQAQYWKLFADDNWKQYPVVPDIKGRDAIIEHKLVENPDFRDLAGLTKLIEAESIGFIGEVEKFITTHELAV